MLVSDITASELHARLFALVLVIFVTGAFLGVGFLVAICFRGANARVRRYVVRGMGVFAAAAPLVMWLTGDWEEASVAQVLLLLIALALAGAFWSGTIATLIEAPAKTRPLLWTLVTVLVVLMLVAWMWLTQFLYGLGNIG